MSLAVHIAALKKNYGKVLALRGIDLSIPQGEFFGLLGPNGAGKSTLINCLVGLAKPSSGQVEVFGHNVRQEALAAKRRIGFSPQEVNVERFFNLRKTLEFQGGFYGFSPAEAKRQASAMLKQFGLEDKAKEQFFRLSGGMQKRLLVARAMMSQPQLLILDEPTAGVDVGQRHELWKYLRDLNQDGTTIILTTHYIDEAEALCERVGIINHGQILELGTPKALIEQYCESRVCIEVSGEIKTSEFSEIPKVQIKDQRVTASTSSIGLTTEKLLHIITQDPKRRILDLNVERGNLEEVFIKVTGKSLSEVEQENTKSA